MLLVFDLNDYTSFRECLSFMITFILLKIKQVEKICFSRSLSLSTIKIDTHEEPAKPKGLV